MESDLEDRIRVIGGFKGNDKWLVSSTAINVYTSILNAYSITQSVPLHFIVDTFVYVTFVKDGEYKERKYKKLLPENIKTYSTLLFPVNIDENHWILIQVNTQWKAIIVFDSIFKPEPDAYKPIVNNIIKIVKGICEQDFDYEDHFLKADCPQQPNGYDCGMYVLNFVEQIIRTKKIAAFDAKRYRELVLKRVENDRLLIEEKIKLSK